MTELLYLYVDRIYSKVNHQEFNFSNEFDVSYKDEKLIIKQTDNNLLENFFGNNINNISLIVGKNGVGKSSILDLISFSQKNRKKIMPRTEFFVIYHVKGDMFYFEGSNKFYKKLFKPIISQFSYKKNIFFSMKNGFPEILEDIFNVPSNSKLKLSYIRSLPDFEWVMNEEPEEDDNKGYINRSYKTDLTASDIYNFLIDIDNKEFLQNAKHIAIEFKQEKQYPANSSYILYDLYHSKFSIMKWNTYEEKNNLRRKKYLRETQDKMYSKFLKEYFMLRLLEKNIVLMINNIMEKSDSLFLNKFTKILDDTFYLSEKDSVKEEILKKINYLLILDEEISKLENKEYFFVRKNKKKLSSLIYHLDKLPKESFKTNNSLVLEIKENDNYRNFLDLFNFKEDNIYREELKMFLKNLSAGEKVYINTFSLMYNHLNSTSEHLLLVLDEPDINFHPEWSRQFIYNLTKLISIRKQKNVQVIISSHSPFIMTDIPNENIFLINERSGVKEVNKTNISFASNLYDLVSTSFFLEYPIGEFARIKIKGLYNENGISNDKRRLLEIIDDPLLRKLLSDNTFQERNPLNN